MIVYDALLGEGLHGALIIGATYLQCRRWPNTARRASSGTPAEVETFATAARLSYRSPHVSQRAISWCHQAWPRTTREKARGAITTIISSLAPVSRGRWFVSPQEGAQLSFLRLRLAMAPAATSGDSVAREQNIARGFTPSMIFMTCRRAKRPPFELNNTTGEQRSNRRI